ncbi:hypothetical protein Agub_g10755 [Astrephomene gubernaculifera]|uniref:Methionine synthase reductase n=1 Tax=Astrephomene gubernaculifera TaxID=47775 RepID=A0AAD3DXB7_9CHLO|nr:hypothetical protein Agub_g10755 [Astrephomene gubernaculifera]
MATIFPMEPTFKESIIWLCCNERPNAPPAQPPVTGPSRRTVELLAGTGSKATTPAPSSAQQPLLLPGYIGSSGPTAGEQPPPPTSPVAASTPPTQQATPSRSLIPEPMSSAKQPTVASAATSKVEEAAAPVTATGGGAILARLRQQRSGSTATNATPAAAAVLAAAAKAKADLEAGSGTAAVQQQAAAKLPVTILYGSQTGTGEEIARNLAASAVEKGYDANCASLNEFGFAALSPSRTPFLVVISSSTGDGDPPDNATNFFNAVRKKPEGTPKPLAGLRYTVLGLGDSNYTRFMYVPRTIKSRLAELGGSEFYKCAEADEVEGVENVVEPWIEGLWEALARAMPQGSTATAVQAPAPKPAEPSKPAAAAAPKPAAAPSAGLAAIMAAAAKARADLETAKPTAAATTAPTAVTATATAAPAAPAAVPAATAGGKLPVTILYGSQTGTAEEIARNLAASAVENGYDANCASLNEFGFAALSPSRTPLLVVLCSSTGDGDPPDNATNFFNAVRKKPEGNPKPLAGLRYTVLGLGDSNYTRFMYVPRTIKSRLAELGGSEFYKCAEADEVEGVENVVEPWIEGLWEALARAMPQGPSGVQQPPAAVQPAAAAPAPPPKPAAAASGGLAAIMAAAAKAKADLEAAATAKQQQSAALAPPADSAADSLTSPPAALAAAEADAAAGAGALEAATASTAAAEQASGSSEPQPQGVADSVQPASAADGSLPVAPEAAAAAAATEGFADGNAEGATAPPPPVPAPVAIATTAAAAPDAAVTAAAEEEDPLLTPKATTASGEAAAAGALAGAASPDGLLSEASGRPGSTTSAMSSTFRRNVEIVKRTHDAAEAAKSRRSVDPKGTGRLVQQAKPINVNFPKREEAIVKRKDEKSYGLLLGLAPVGVDTKGAPALLPCRIKVQWEKDEARAKAVRDKEAARPTREERHRIDPEGNYTAAQPFWAHVSNARYETAFWSDRKVLHLEFSIRGSNITYQPGDAVGVLPVNHPDLVLNLCKRLRLSPDRVLHINQAAAGGAASSSSGGAAASGTRVASHIPSPCSLSYALTHCVDLTSATRKSVLRLLAEHTTDAAERRTLMFLSAKGGREAYAHEIGEHQPSLLDLLVRFHSCHPPLDALLDALPPLMPRMYSISSSQREQPNHLSVAMSVVRFKTRYGTRLGVATTWLDRLAAPFTAEAATPPSEPIWVPIFLRRAADFKPPPDLATPLVMVGPGTGVAPFRGFLQDRRAVVRQLQPPPEAVGEAVLFFGCRREDEDYLYREELEGFREGGTLAALHVAYSRAQVDKVYVQDLIKQQGEKVWSLLQAGGRVFICGDGAHMAKDVHATLVGIAVQHGGLSEEEAAAYFTTLTQEKRYVRDVWS